MLIGHRRPLMFRIFVPAKTTCVSLCQLSQETTDGGCCLSCDTQSSSRPNCWVNLKGNRSPSHRHIATLELLCLVTMPCKSMRLMNSDFELCLQSVCSWTAVKETSRFLPPCSPAMQHLGFDSCCLWAQDLHVEGIRWSFWSFQSFLSRDRLCRSQQEKPQKLISSSQRKGSWKWLEFGNVNNTWDIEARWWGNLMVFNGKRMKWQRHWEKKTCRQVIHWACGEALRPILLTCASTSCNMLPALCVGYCPSIDLLLQLNKRFRIIVNETYNVS